MDPLVFQERTSTGFLNLVMLAEIL